MKRVAAPIFAIAALTVTALMLPGCSQYSVVPLEVSGYSYEVGDIVLIDVEKAPEVDDLVLYDANVNGSHCMAFGPGVYLAKVIGVPGDQVNFSKGSFEANGQVGSYEGWGPMSVMWGKERYEDVTNMELRVPEGEYLADKSVGQECPPGEYDEHGNSISYGRFTIKREAIKGIILKKVWHSKRLEEEYKRRVY